MIYRHMKSLEAYLSLGPVGVPICVDKALLMEFRKSEELQDMRQDESQHSCCCWIIFKNL